MFYLSLCFYGEQLSCVDFWFNNHPGENIITDGNDWSEEYERAQQRKFEQWLTAQIGTRRTFGWGKIEAYYSSNRPLPVWWCGFEWR